MDLNSLKLIVRDVICEEDEFGYSYGNPNSLFDIFVKPVADVGKIAGAEAKKTYVRGKHVVRTTLEAIISTLVPILDADYAQINEKMQSKLSEIKASAPDAYQEVYRALHGKDALMTAFLYSPVTMINYAAGSKIAKKIKSFFGIKEDASNKNLQRISADVKEIVQNKLKNVSKFAHEIANAKNTNDLFGALGKHPKQSVNIDDKLSDTKKKLLTKLQQNVESDIKKFIASGVPRKAPIIQDHQKVVSIIKQIGGPRD